MPARHAVEHVEAHGITEGLAFLPAAEFLDHGAAIPPLLSSTKLCHRFIHGHDVLGANFRQNVMDGVEHKTATGRQDFQPALHVLLDLGRG